MRSFIGFFKYILMILTSAIGVEARYCRSEGRSEHTFYKCPRNEYCCSDGCCISPTFQFYQLWYYWLMVVFMFLICSGGQWWYRYMVGARCGTSIPPPIQRRSSQRPARVAYTPARDTVILHQIWKPTFQGGSGPPPAYSPACQSGGGVGSSQDSPKPSPYMQLYGPPPSYESVVGGRAGPPIPVEPLVGGRAGPPTPLEPMVGGRAGPPIPLEPMVGGRAGPPIPGEYLVEGQAGPLTPSEPLAGGRAGPPIPVEPLVHAPPPDFPTSPSNASNIQEQPSQPAPRT